MVEAVRWSLAKCIFVLLCAAGLSDRRLSIEEREEIGALAARSPSMHEIADSAREAMWREVLGVYESGDWDKFVSLALNALPRDVALGRAIYAQCADIVFADRVVKGAERRFLTRLARSTGLAHADVNLIDKVMALKNRR